MNRLYCKLFLNTRLHFDNYIKFNINEGRIVASAYLTNYYFSDEIDFQLKPNKMYKVSGWASVNNIEEGRPIWEIATEYLKTIGQYKVDNTKNVNVIGEKDNIGIDI